jgi:hypothetical protein
MKNAYFKIIIGVLLLINLSLVSSLATNADYVVVYPGEEARVSIEIENTEDFDIEDVSIQILLSSVLEDGTPVSLPFTFIGSSEREIDDISDGDEESVSFVLRPSTDITPGDYNIPYSIRYFEEDEDVEYEDAGTFAIRVSARTELDYVIELRDDPIVGRQGTISLEVINMGLGEIKSMSIEVFPEGYDLKSKSKVFIGTINADDTDTASFDAVYTDSNPRLNAKITYKDFENKDQVEQITIPFQAYTVEEALQKGLIQQNNTALYVVIVIVVIIAWIVWRRMRKRRRKKK